MEFIFICSFAQQKYGNYSAASKLLKIFHFYIFSLLGKVIEFRSHYFKSPQIDFFGYFVFHTFDNRQTLFKLHFSLKTCWRFRYLFNEYVRLSSLFHVFLPSCVYNVLCVSVSMFLSNNIHRSLSFSVFENPFLSADVFLYLCMSVTVCLFYSFWSLLSNFCKYLQAKGLRGKF